MSRQMILYTTSHCHLCELALVMIDELRLRNWVELIEIADNDLLIERYGTKIPVLAKKDHHVELCWPFQATDILHFIST
jgi:hypothetical protein